MQNPINTGFCIRTPTRKKILQDPWYVMVNSNETDRLKRRSFKEKPTLLRSV